jgi:hypothetical protein
LRNVKYIIFFTMSRRLDAFEIPDKTKAYVKSTLNPFLEGVVLDLIRDQPSDPARYMYDCLRKTLHVDEELRNEIESQKVCVLFRRLSICRPKSF